MHMSLHYYFLWLMTINIFQVALGQSTSEAELDGSVICLKANSSHLFQLKPRRYDIQDVGYELQFHGWADVQGQGAANDYCRVVGYEHSMFLSCDLAGSSESKMYNSATKGFDLGFPNTWYMKDEDGDGRDDYCRCAIKDSIEQVVCTRAGTTGFLGSLPQWNDTDVTFSPTGPMNCRNRLVFPEFGKSPSK